MSIFASDHMTGERQNNRRLCYGLRMGQGFNIPSLHNAPHNLPSDFLSVPVMTVFQAGYVHRVESQYDGIGSVTKSMSLVHMWIVGMSLFINV